MTRSGTIPNAFGAFVDDWVRSAPELFPAGFDRGYRLHGFGRQSRKLPGMKLRKVVTDDGSSYWLRPSFVTGYMTGTVDELAYPLLLAAHGVPAWLLKIGFGHSEMYWHRVVERLGRSSLVGTTVRDPARLPGHLAADEHHADWSGQKGYVATTVGGGCILGVALTAAADDAHLREAYGVFAAEARNIAPEYAPETVNTDGWAATQNAFRSLFPAIAVVLCFPHGFLKIRDRCRKARDLHRRVWDVYRAASAEEFRRLMDEFQQWCTTQTWPASVHDMLAKLWSKTESYAAAYAPSGMPSHEQRGGPADEPVVPADVRGSGPARPSGLVRVAAAGLGAAGELRPSRRGVRNASGFREPCPSAQRQMLSMSIGSTT